MTEGIISFETAKLAKEKGLNNSDYPTAWYNKDAELIYGIYDGEYLINDDNLVDPYYTAWTQSILQKWLREKHGKHINVDCNHSGWYYNICKTNGTAIIDFSSYDYLKTYEEALEVGLIESLKLIHD